MMRYPDKQTGLNFYQKRLLHHADKGPNAARIIGYTMGMIEDNELDYAGDEYLFDLLKKLGDEQLPYPAFVLKGDTSTLHSTQAQLTDWGIKYRNGEENFTRLNGIDYWVGGVHLTPENLWYYSDGRLVAHDAQHL